MAAGQVTTGFSKPYVAKYTVDDGTITYTDATLLARGVNVNVEAEGTDDNKFYADNITAEEESGKFKTGTLTLTVDGCKTAAEQLIMGVPAAGSDGWTVYDDDQNIPFMGVGFIRRTREEGTDYWTPYIITKVRFDQIPINADTQEEDIDWQTTELSAKIFRGEDAKRTWRKVGARQTSESAAETALRTALGISSGSSGGGGGGTG